MEYHLAGRKTSWVCVGDRKVWTGYSQHCIHTHSKALIQSFTIDPDQGWSLLFRSSHGIVGDCRDTYQSQIEDWCLCKYTKQEFREFSLLSGGAAQEGTFYWLCSNPGRLKYSCFRCFVSNDLDTWTGVAFKIWTWVVKCYKTSVQAKYTHKCTWYQSTLVQIWAGHVIHGVGQIYQADAGKPSSLFECM